MAGFALLGIVTKLQESIAMQVLTSKCPYCKHEVDSTIEQISEPVVCPICKKPFEIEIPTAVVTSVHEVDEKNADNERMATKRHERTLVKVHPVVFRSRPLLTLCLGLLFLIALGMTLMSFTEMTVFGYQFNETRIFGTASVLTWVCAITLMIIAALALYGVLLSRFTTLTITDERTIYQEGIVSRSTSEVQHNDVRNIKLDQTFPQRLLGVGGIGISSSGQDDLEVVATRLPHPERIIELIRENQA